MTATGTRKIAFAAAAILFALAGSAAAAERQTGAGTRALALPAAASETEIVTAEAAPDAPRAAFAQPAAGRERQARPRAA